MKGLLDFISWQITIEAIENEVDEIALQGIEFWSTVCDEEVDLAIELSEVRSYLLQDERECIALAMTVNKRECQLSPKSFEAMLMEFHMLFRLEGLIDLIDTHFVQAWELSAETRISAKPKKNPRKNFCRSAEKMLVGAKIKWHHF